MTKIAINTVHFILAIDQDTGVNTISAEYNLSSTMPLFRDKKIAEFPDSVTSRGSKHLKALIRAIKKGYKSYLLFLIQIEGAEKFKIAKDIDKEYYENYLLAKKAGVVFLAYRCKINSKEIKVEKKIKIVNDWLFRKI